MKHLPTIILTAFITLAIVFAGMQGIIRHNEITDSVVTSRGLATPEIGYFAEETSSFLALDDLTPESEVALIQTGSIDMRVRDIDKTIDDLLEIANTYDGEVTNRSISRYDDRYSGYATLQVPSSDFEAALNDVEAIAELIDSISINADDVSDQLVDIDARLRAAVAEENRYLELLSAANNVEDLLAIERELSRIRTTIERYDAQLASLEDEVAFASLYISMTQELTLPLEGTRFRPGQDVIDALSQLALIARSIATGLIYLVIIGGAILIPVVLIYLLTKPFISTYGKKRKK